MTMIKSSKLVIFYASQTGNAEWIAKHIASEAIDRGFQSSVLVLNDHAQVC